MIDLKSTGRWILLSLAMSAPLAQGATVQKVGMADMLRDSRLVIHGVVEDRWTGADTDASAIYTHVRIRVLDVVKGDDPGESLELRFLGGTHGGLTLAISDQYVPPVGDEAVYFIEDPARTQVNPIYGWRQGHFPIRFDQSGAEKLVFTHDLQPVLAVSPESTPIVVEISQGVAAGVDTAPEPDQPGMSLESFKQQLRAMEEALK